MKWIEGWYSSYALLGASAAGILPIVLPVVVERTSVASEIGLVMAAFSFGGLTAPFWGRLADAWRLHKGLLAGGLLVTAAASAVFAFVPGTSARIALALLAGIGIAAASTTANLFVVEAHPKREWDARIGWLQTFYGVGQVAGLLLAGLLARAASLAGLLAAAGLSAAAVLPALLATPAVPSGPVRRRPALVHAARHAEWPSGSPQRLYHHLTLRGLRLLGSPESRSFGLFLLGWFISFGGSAAFFSLYPIIMQKSYGVGPALSSAGFAVWAGIGLFLYAPAGKWSARRRPLGVLQVGMLIRLAAYGLLVLLGPALPGWGAELGFLAIVAAWSVLSVASTALVADRFAGGKNEGEGIGVFNAVTALAGVVGSACGGWLAGAWGYGAVPALALGGTAVGLVVLTAAQGRASIAGRAGTAGRIEH